MICVLLLWLPDAEVKTANKNLRESAIMTMSHLKLTFLFFLTIVFDEWSTNDIRNSTDKIVNCLGF